ncbi:MAG TPA: class I SAM-dependent methyltransferase [Xanthobacteraceae bacterium]|nr:class I SAM-dependent methyltransferase [Xanthobacteraceae bacterium]
MLKERTMLPHGDHTPPGYVLPLPAPGERLKRPLRRLLYPVWTALVSPRLAARYATPEFQPDLWLWGHRGSDFERHRRRVDRYRSLADCDMLVAGCGTGRDIESWLGAGPRQVVGLDWFRYDSAWALWQEHFRRIAPEVKVSFGQADLTNLEDLPAESFDVVGSDAVFEHLRDLPAVLKQCHRILRCGGLIYATFGPLWYTWGGDHVSGYDALEAGFNHLLLDDRAWHAYLDRMGPATHSEHDGRTWVEHDLFSRLRPSEYLDCLTRAGFERLFVAAIIDPRAVRCLGKRPDLASILLARYCRLDLIVSAMTIIYRRA